MRWTIALAVLATGCGSQFGEENGAMCVAQSRTPLAGDETAPSGVVPADMLALAAGDQVVDLDWTQLGTSTQLTLGATHAGGAMEYVDYEIESDGGANLLEIGCTDQVEIEVTLAAITADGELDESFATRLIGVMPGEVQVSAALEGLTGTFDPWDHAPAGNGYDDMKAWLDVTFDATGAHGEIAGQGSGTDSDPNDPNGTAYAENVPIASFGAATE